MTGIRRPAQALSAVLPQEQSSFRSQLGYWRDVKARAEKVRDENRSSPTRNCLFKQVEPWRELVLVDIDWNRSETVALDDPTHVGMRDRRDGNLAPARKLQRVEQKLKTSTHRHANDSIVPPGASEDAAAELARVSRSATGSDRVEQVPRRQIEAVARIDAHIPQILLRVRRIQRLEKTSRRAAWFSC